MTSVDRVVVLIEYGRVAAEPADNVSESLLTVKLAAAVGNLLHGQVSGDGEKCGVGGQVLLRTSAVFHQRRGPGKSNAHAERNRFGKIVTDGERLRASVHVVPAFRFSDQPRLTAPWCSFFMESDVDGSVAKRCVAVLFDWLLC